jgi:hypothetical protein
MLLLRVQSDAILRVKIFRNFRFPLNIRPLTAATDSPMRRAVSLVDSSASSRNLMAF